MKTKMDYLYLAVIMVLVCIQCFRAGTAYADASELRTRFDTDTDVMLTRLDDVLLDVQEQLDPNKKVMDVPDYVKAALLKPSEIEKAQKATEALSILEKIGVESDSEEAKAIVQKLFKTDTVPIVLEGDLLVDSPDIKVTR